MELRLGVAVTRLMVTRISNKFRDSAGYGARGLANSVTKGGPLWFAENDLSATPDYLVRMASVRSAIALHRMQFHEKHVEDQFGPGLVCTQKPTDADGSRRLFYLANVSYFLPKFESWNCSFREEM